MRERNFMLADLTRTTAKIELAEDLMDLLEYHLNKKSTNGTTIKRLRSKLKYTIKQHTEQQQQLNEALGPKLESA